MDPYADVRLDLQKQAVFMANSSLVVQTLMFGCVYRASPDVYCPQPWVPLTVSCLALVMFITIFTRIAFMYKARVARYDAAPESFLRKVARNWRLVYVVVCICCVVWLFVMTVVVGRNVKCGQSRIAAPI